MAFDVNSFTADLLKDVQIDDQTKASLTTAFTNPAVAKRLEESTLRQADYSKRMEEYKGQVKAAQEYWEGLRQWDKEAKVRQQKLEDGLRQRLADEGVSLNDDTGVPVKTNGVTQEELQRLANESVQYMNTMTTIQARHLKEFNDVLDVDELMKVVERDKVNVKIAYERLIQPKREEIQQADIVKQLAQAREEGKQEALKNIQIPITDQPINSIVANAGLDRISLKDKSPEYGAMAAVKAFRESQRSSS